MSDFEESSSDENDEEDTIDYLTDKECRFKKILDSLENNSYLNIKDFFERKSKFFEKI